MLRLPILVSSLILSSLPAHAGMLPAFDSEALCMDVAGTSVRQEIVMYGCMDFQDRMRKEISLRWDRLPVYVQDSCAKAAETTGDVCRAQRAQQQLRDALEHGVAARVAEAVVDLLEVIEVRHHERERGAVAPRPLELDREYFRHITA